MIAIGNFFFKYRNFIFPLFALSILIPSPLLFSEKVFGENNYLVAFIIGTGVAILGQFTRAITIGLKYIVRGGKNKKVYANDLVVEGMFRHCRNPLYVGNILMLLGTGLIANSIYFFTITFPLFCFVYQAIVLAEENYLRGKFGAQYDHYFKTVNRWTISLKGIGSTFSSMTFNWKRYIFSESNTIYVLLTASYFVVLIQYPYFERYTTVQKVQLSSIVVGLITLPFLIVKYFKRTEKLKKVNA